MCEEVGVNDTRPLVDVAQMFDPVVYGVIIFDPGDMGLGERFSESGDELT